MNLSANSIGFIAGVLTIALVCWYIRTRIESNPEPFFLSLTFFAFAGQFIRFAEATSRVIEDKRTFQGWGTMIFYVIVGGLVIAIQAWVMNRHRSLTKHHYRTLLVNGLKPENNLTAEKRVLLSDSWSEVLLRITDVDLFPRGYAWIKRLFPENDEPKERSRVFALTVLPRDEFIVVDGDNGSASANDGKASKAITLKKLEVPPTLKRHFYWWTYVGLCVFSWILFVRAMGVSQSQQFTNTSHQQQIVTNQR